MAHFTHHSEENYLKALYKLSYSTVKKVNNTALSQLIGHNPATVLEMVRKLVGKNLVTTLPNKSLKLTPSGEKKALLIIRKHRLWEVFLTEKLNYSWNEVHVLAEQLEHIESNDLVDRLEKYLGFPAVDPHGDTIPDKKGKLKVQESIPLENAVAGKNYRILNLADTNDVFLQYLEKLNIRPGKKIKLVSRNQYDNSVMIMLLKKIIPLSEKVTKNILVEPA
ncbi:MAG: metal-dependent transcriptional regulator [Chitinophagaceae bacterium]|nr:MAG: metal-dependent transcriptional regulator [Chitinophagaceae bacterium]